VNKTFSGFDQPQSIIIAGNYTTPKILATASGFGSKVISMLARDWTFGTVLHYASGFLIKVPAATTSLTTYDFQNTNVNRVPGVPLFTQNLNCHCFDPNTTFVLNPNAWANPPLGQFGTANAYYSDYRQQRHPQEAVSIGRVFRIKERATLQIRAEFTNIFNRTGLNAPTSTNAFATQTTKNGQTTGGFGWINPAAMNATAFNPAAATPASFPTPLPRQGQLVARFQF
jgi:hypothetical protein